MRNIESVKQELKAEITIGNMRNILPIIRKSAETMELIKSRLTGEREKDNQMILDTVKEIIENENRTEMFYHDNHKQKGLLMTLIDILQK